LNRPFQGRIAPANTFQFGWIELLHSRCASQKVGKATRDQFGSTKTDQAIEKEGGYHEARQSDRDHENPTPDQ
jgi:hypothetical protein